MLCGYHFASSRDPNIFCEGSMSTILLPIDLQGEFFVVNLHSFMANIQNFSVVHHKIHTQCHRIDDIGYKTLCEIFLLPISISARISPDTPTGCRNQVVSRGLWSPHSYKHQSYYVISGSKIHDYWTSLYRNLSFNTKLLSLHFNIETVICAFGIWG